MPLSLQTTFRHVDASPSVEAAIRERAERLEHLFGRITSCRVVIDGERGAQRHGKLYSCAIDLMVPGGTIVVGRAGQGENHAHEDIYVAIRDAFDAAARQLEDHARRVRADVKVHEAPSLGRVARLFPDQGYGFAILPDGQEIYFHRNSVLHDHFPQLTEGAQVRVVIAEGEGEKGPQATTVALIGKPRLVNR